MFFSLQYNLNSLITISGRIVYLSLLPLPITLNLCSFELISSTLTLDTSSTLNPQQKARINQHLCFNIFYSLIIWMNLSFGKIVGNLFTSLDYGNKI